MSIGIGLVTCVVVAVVVALVVRGDDNGSSAANTPAPRNAIASLTKIHTFYYPECPPVHGLRWVYPQKAAISSTLYESFAIGYRCRDAATWIKRLARDVIPVSKKGGLVRVDGPAGFKCSAWPDADDHAYAGGCYTDKGKVSFGWNWNVANPRVVFAPGPKGTPEPMRAMGADTLSNLRMVGGNRVEVTIENTSGIGILNTFTWSPPPDWKISAIIKTTGGTCRLVSGTIRCMGTILPPSCLCAGNGGSVTIEMAIDSRGRSTTHGQSIIFSIGGSKLDIRRMTPVPFLIPDTPQQASRQHSE